MTKRYVIVDSDVLWKLLRAEQVPGCSASPALLPRLFGAPILTTTAGNEELARLASESEAVRSFTASPPKWLLVHKPVSAFLGPLSPQFTQDAADLQVISLAFLLAREPASVLVLTDNTDVHRALRQLDAQMRNRVLVATIEVLLAHAAESGLIADLMAEIDALKPSVHWPSAAAILKLRELDDYVKKSGVQTKPPEPDEGQLLAGAKHSQCLMASMGLHISDEEALATTREFHENGGPAAVRAEIETAKRLAKEQNRPWHVVMAELGKAEVEAKWKMAHEIAKRTGRRPADVFGDLDLAEMRQKSKKSPVN